jgi:hypothetical protein
MLREAETECYGSDDRGVWRSLRYSAGHPNISHSRPLSLLSRRELFCGLLQMAGGQGSVRTMNDKYSTQNRQPILHLHRLMSITAPFSPSTRAKFDARKKVLMLVCPSRGSSAEPANMAMRSLRGPCSYPCLQNVTAQRKKGPPRSSPCLGWPAWHTERRPRPGVSALFSPRSALFVIFFSVKMPQARGSIKVSERPYCTRPGENTRGTTSRGRTKRSLLPNMAFREAGKLPEFRVGARSGRPMSGDRICSLPSVRF